MTWPAPPLHTNVSSKPASASLTMSSMLGGPRGIRRRMSLKMTVLLRGTSRVASPLVPSTTSSSVGLISPSAAVYLALIVSISWISWVAVQPSPLTLLPSRSSSTPFCLSPQQAASELRGLTMSAKRPCRRPSHVHHSTSSTRGCSPKRAMCSSLAGAAATCPAIASTDTRKMAARAAMSKERPHAVAARRTVLGREDMAKRRRWQLALGCSD
mmetsp:Transcript_38206/g.120668  ORF Transcript_38206/g.120668 Transcript_38206/m.120668 type:complete len:213 (-) Transcript_38206:111-749(-)